MNVETWTPEKKFSGFVKDLRNRFAGHHRLTPAPELTHPDFAFALELEEPLPEYPLVCHYECGYGDLYLGLEAGAIFPEYASETITRVARTDEALHAWLDWLVTPWVGKLEHYLGVTLSLRKANVNAAFLQDSVAFLLDLEGHRGHFAVAGSALGHMPWHRTLSVSTTTKRPMGLPFVEAHTLIEAGPFALQEIRRLIRGALLRFGEPNYALHVGDLAQGVRLNMSGEDGGMSVGSPMETASNRWRMMTMTQTDNEKQLALEDVAFGVDVLLDRRLVPLAEIERVAEGSIYPISPATPGRTVALCCNGRVFARGELVSVEGQLAVLISEGVGVAAC